MFAQITSKISYSMNVTNRIDYTNVDRKKMITIYELEHNLHNIFV